MIDHNAALSAPAEEIKRLTAERDAAAAAGMPLLARQLDRQLAELAAIVFGGDAA